MELNQKAPFVLQSGDSLGTQKRQGVSKTKIAVLSALGVLLTLSVASICRCPSRSSSMQAGHVSGYTQPAGLDPAKVLLDTPSPEQLRKHLQYYTSGTHVAGINRTQAVYTRDYFKEQGIEAEIVEYYPWMNYPLDQRVALFNSSTDEVVFEAGLKEDVIPGDPATDDPNNLPAFHGYSADGNVTGQLVYANYGTREDFQALKDAGISIKDKIVLVRYGDALRGLKIYAAALDGARGVLIYSDPADDGYVKGKVYPDGPWRPESSFQRGSVGLIQIYPGDPLTPGYAATKDAPRLKPEEVKNLNTIPSLPISYRDAEPLLRAIQGYGKQAKTIGDNWVGGLTSKGVEYWTGPSELNVNLLNKVEYKITPIQNVIARIPGHEEPERAVIIGNHRDAWCAGASDPSSGSAALLELARSFGELLKLGWRPRRTIIFASWDAEEYGLIGSTEWVEENVDMLRENAVAYLNVDTAVIGSGFGTSASPVFKKLIYDVTKQVIHPGTNETVYENWLKKSIENGTQADLNAEDSDEDTFDKDDFMHDYQKHKGKHAKKNKKVPPVPPLGSGSDFTAFMAHAGISSLNMGFEGYKGAYHSNYDNFDWMTRFIDPDMKLHQAMTQLWGLLTIRLADDPIIGFSTVDYAKDINMYLKTIERHVAVQLEKSDTSDGKDIDAQVAKKLRHMRSAQHNLLSSARRLQRDRKRLQKVFGDQCQMTGRRRKAACLHMRRSINNRNYKLERHFIDPEGIAGREWYKHILVSPGRWMGYGSQVLPALAEASEDQNWGLFQKLEKRAADIINEAAWFLHEE